MKKKNDVVNGLKGTIEKDKKGKKTVTVKFELNNKLGYDGCGTHTHK